MSTEQRFKVAVLLSGTGRTLENLLAVRARGDLDIDIPVVVSSRNDVRGLEIAREAGIETHVITRRDARTPQELSRQIKAIVEPHGVDLFALAGYLRQLEILREWEWRILNIHPSLLPLFGGRGMYGRRVHEAVLASGMKVSGCTVHFVNEEYDAGPIFLQRCVPVHADDTPEALGGRVFEMECQLYPEAIRLIAEGRVEMRGNQVFALSEPTDEQPR